MLVSDVIRGALTKIGVIDPQGAIETDWTTMGITELSDMLQHWAAEGLLIHALTTHTKVLTVADAIYTIGASGDFNVQRPVDIRDAMITGDSRDSECRIDTSIFRYQEIETKTTQGRPDELYYDPTYLSGLASIYLYPTPDQAYTLTLKVLTAHVALTLATDTIVVPPEYDYAIKANFAVRMMSHFGKTMPLVLQEAVDSKAILMRNNAKRFISPAKIDSALLAPRSSNITTG